jgi:hypothetical protein
MIILFFASTCFGKSLFRKKKLSLESLTLKSLTSLICTELGRIRGVKLTFKKFCPFSSQNCPKFGYSFRPFLNYAAQKSASWILLLASGGEGGG